MPGFSLVLEVKVFLKDRMTSVYTLALSWASKSTIYKRLLEPISDLVKRERTISKCRTSVYCVVSVCRKVCYKPVIIGKSGRLKLRICPREETLEKSI